MAVVRREPFDVVILAPSIAPIGTEQERIGLPPMCTVQAPHCAMPQPNFVPVRPTTSRKTQSSGVSGSISMRREVPLTSIVITVALLRGDDVAHKGTHKLHLAAAAIKEVDCVK
jgi:hypothetical protein